MNHPAEPFGELIRCFDETGKEIEPHSRKEVHKKPLKYWHGTTGIVVVNPQGQILCSKRSEFLSQRPGVWQGCFGGHVNAGQSFEENAVRELADESGIKITEKDLVYLDEIKNDNVKHICKMYTCLFIGNINDLIFNDGEITEVKWIDMSEAWKDKIQNPDKWGSGISPELQILVQKWLQSLV